ncbi:MAG TPA: vitamin B12 dependent-methionine synthase activation domain-containing protein [Spirochaetota bacterium]|nr:vitamin B12 dependent-methionine synthase activation domain-containing protein [Spirochaetota bacterium]HPJ35269.1 vitamin B12 dependent-methionine synthase activation domain-containing protein [Spirochaetota bacterium]
MSKLNIINHIPVSLPEKEILFRMKYNVHKTEIDDESRQMFRSVMNRGFAVCEPRGVWTLLLIEGRSENSVSFEGGLSIESGSIAKLLQRSDSAVFMGVTAGAEISRLSEDSIRKGDGASALIYDAVGSETAEASIEWLNRYIGSELRRKGKILTPMRFSAGYGDFLLENQRIFYELLDLKRFGVNLTESCIFVPEKTVTAIAGVEAPAEER